MNERDKHISVFGEIRSLAEPMPWSSGIDNLFEWVTWYTNNVLGIKKTEYWKKIIGWSVDSHVKSESLADKIKYIELKLKAETAQNEQLNRYTKPKYTIASPREALRRAKYFSEDYLNKEFDVFWALVSDAYLDKYYAQFTRVSGGGRWFTHGHSQFFANSVGIQTMQMDNLSYSPSEQLLVANELKLGGKKNPDQILKYALMFKLLRERDFISDKTRFLLLFIGDQTMDEDWENLITLEQEHCEKSTKSTAKLVLDPEVIGIARAASYSSTTWRKLMIFNETQSMELDATTQQVEKKLLWGFNETLSVKNFIQV